MKEMIVEILDNIWLKFKTMISSVTNMYGLWKLTELPLYTLDKAMTAIILMSNAVIEKAGGSIVDSTNANILDRAAALFILGTEKPQWATAHWRANTYANKQANEEKQKIVMAILVSNMINVLIGGRLIWAMMTSAVAFALVLLDQHDSSIMVSILTSEMTLLSKVIYIVVYAGYVMKLVKSPKILKYILLPMIVAGSLAESEMLECDWLTIDNFTEKFNIVTKIKTRQIGQYWKKKGLEYGSNTASRWAALNHEINAEELDETQYLDIVKWFDPTNKIRERVKERVHSKLDDSMLIKAINKRLAGEKPKIDNKAM